MFDLGSAVGYLLLDTSGFKKGIEEANKGFEKFSKDTISLSGRLDGLGVGLTSIGGTLTKNVTTPILGAGAAMVYAANDFDSALKNIKSATGAAADEMKSFEKVLDNVYKGNYGEGYDDIANAISEIRIQMGKLSDKEMQEVTEDALALRDVFGYDIKESIRSVDTLMKNFGLSSKEAFDYIVKGQQEGLDFSGEFLDTINEYSVQFGKLGFSAEEMFNILETGAETGAWNLDKIGDAIKEFSIRAIDGSDTTRQGFEALGLSVDEMANKFANGGDEAKEAFSIVLERLSKMDDSVAQNIAGVNLFGTMWEDLGPDVVTQLADISSAADGMKGSMDALKESKYDTFANDIKSLGREVKDLAKDFGAVLLPSIRDFVKYLSNLVDKFSNLSDNTKKVIIQIAAFAAILGPLLTIVGNIVSFVSTLINLLGGASGLGAAISSLAGPIGIAIAVVTALFAAWQTNFGGIRDYTFSVVESIKDIIGTLASYVSSGLELLKSAWDENLLGIRTIVENWWEGLQTYWEMIFSTIAGLFEAFALLLEGDWEGFWNKIKEIVTNIWDTIKELFGLFLDTIVITLINIGYSLYEAAVNTFNKIKEGFSIVWDIIKEWFARAIEDPVGTVLSIGTALYEAGKSIFESLWDGLKSVWNSITDWVSDCIDWIKEKVKFWKSEADKVSGRDSDDGRARGSYATGLDYIPRDMNVRVHEGERILTKQENERYNRGTSARLYMNVTFTEKVDKDAAKKVSKELADETVKQLRSKGVVLV